MGVDGFLGNLDTLYEMADEDTEEWSTFLTWLTAQLPGTFTAADVIEALEGRVDNDLPSDLANAYGKQGFSRKLGHSFSSQAERWYEGMRLVRVGTSHGAAVWEVEKGS